jgi:hypothetical protein
MFIKGFFFLIIKSIKQYIFAYFIIKISQHIRNILPIAFILGFYLMLFIYHKFILLKFVIVRTNIWFYFNY